ncbi:MAG: hypothetical protein VX617_07755 [Pseudomonadota bacterium]|nr:hypothetical protein [Pseudomonadota bacterium]
MKGRKMGEFDIILVFYLARKHDYYAHIIKELSSKYRIGLLLSDEENFYDSRKGHRKVINTERMFLSLCVQLGAEKIYVNQEVKGKIVIMPVELFHTDNYMSKFEKNISWDKLIGLFFFKGGVNKLDMIKNMGAKKYFVPAKYIFEKRIKYEGKLIQIENLDIVETGFLYKRYPIFDGSYLDIDYLVAYPSHVHFRGNKEKEKYMFVANLYKMLKKIDKHNKIYLKKHNNNDNSSFFPSLSVGPTWLLKVSCLIVDLSLVMSPILKQQLYTMGVKLKNSVIERKYPLLEDITQYHNLGIENFLPYVRKGLITGTSASQFHALYNELPVYNCDSQVDDEVATLPHNEEFLVPFHGGQLVFDRSHFNRISKECKSADMINLIKGELSGL